MPFLAPLVPLAAGAIGIGGAASAASGGGGGAPAGGGVDNSKSNDFQWGGYGAGSSAKLDKNGLGPGMPGYSGHDEMISHGSGAQDAANRYQGMGAAAGGNAAPQANYDVANHYSGMGDQARDSQGNALGMMQSAAQGNQPSAAAIQMQQGNDAAVANQMSMAAGARGAGAMAGAQQQAMGNASQMSTQNQNNMGALRAQEMASARGAYGNMATGMRSGDLAAQGAAANQSQFQSQMQGQQNALNQQGQMGYEQMGYNVNNAQLGARMGYQGFNQDQWKAQAGMDASSRDASAANWKTGIQTGVDIGKGAMGAFSDAGLKDGISDISPDRGTTSNVDGSKYSPSPSMGDRAKAGGGAMTGKMDAGPQSFPIDFGSRHRDVQLPPMQMSDARAKDHAYEMGMRAGQAQQGRQEERTPTRSQITSDGRDFGNDYEAIDPRRPPPGTVFDSSGPVQHRSDAVAALPAPAPPQDSLARAVGAQREQVAELPPPKPNSELDQAFAAMPPKSFEYKPGVPGTQPGVQQAGIIAQDAERHPLTAAMVRETPHGKAIDLGTATSLNLAANSEHSQRLRALEAHLGGAMRPKVRQPVSMERDEPQMGGRR